MIRKDITEDEVAKFKSLLLYFKQLSEDGISPNIEPQLTSMLEYTMPYFSNLILKDSFQEINRLTINQKVVKANKRIHEIKDLKYPPKEKVIYNGRCNYKNQSILYGSFLQMTAFDELKPKKGDIISISTWKLKDDYALTYVPIFKNQPVKSNLIHPETGEIINLTNLRTLDINKVYEEKLKDYPSYAKEQMDLLIQFVTDEFTKRVNPSNDLDYIFSAFFSNKILYEFENGTIDAIYYPSVGDKLNSENLAVKPDIFDLHYELYKVEESIMMGSPADGIRGYNQDATLDCTSFNYASGKILWPKDKFFQDLNKIEYYKKEFQATFD